MSVEHPLLGERRRRRSPPRSSARPGRRRRRSGSRRRGRGWRPRRRRPSRPGAASRARGRSRGASSRSSRTLIERKLTRPRVALRELVDQVLGRQAVGAPGEPERDHQRPVEQVADADHLRAARPGRPGCARSSAGTGSTPVSQSSWKTFASPSCRAEQLGDGELAAAARRSSVALAPRMPSSRVLQRVRGRDHDHDQERDPDPERVAARRLARRPRPVLIAPRSSRVGRRPHARRGAAAASRDGANPVSAQTSAAGRTTSTPSSATPRSITVTMPKSRSIRMSVAISAAKPAIAVIPEASTAIPVRE